MYKLKPGKYLNPVSDVVFKNLMKDSDNKDYLAKIISIVTKLDYDYVIDNIVLVDTDTLDNNVGEHHNTGDLVVNIDDTKINIEASLDNKKINKRKNEIMSYKYASNGYKVNSKYDSGYVFIQICIENYDVFSNDFIINEVYLIEATSGNYEIETRDFKKFHINLKQLKKKCYNELTNEERYFKLLSTDDVKELKKIAGDDEIMRKVVKKLDVLSHDKDMLEAYDKERIVKHSFEIALKETKEEGIELGKQEQKMEIVKKMLEQNIDVNTIIACTGLTREKIEELM